MIDSVEDDYPGARFNNTFRGDYSTRFNACVGENGQPDYYEYANGFADAAIYLIDRALEECNVDEQVYPICFNMRHSVELRLKHQIERLKLIRPTVSFNDFDASSSHHIGDIWSYFKRKALEIDQRYSDLVGSIDEYVCDIAEVDPTGQTFRYPLSNESVKHLVEVSLINIFRLREQFTILRKKLEDLHDLTRILIDEYGQGSYTKSLSRKDIGDIAARLPNYSDWGVELAAIKEEIKSDYGIGSKEFGDCLVLMKENYEFSKKIGLKVPLKVLTQSELNVFFECLVVLHPLENYKKPARIISSIEALNMEDMLESSFNDQLAISLCIDEISPEAFVDIKAIYEFGRYTQFTEYYNLVFGVEAKMLHIYSSEPSEFYKAIGDQLDKTNAYELIVKALKALHQDEMVEELDNMFDLSSVFEFLHD